MQVDGSEAQNWVFPQESLVMLDCRRTERERGRKRETKRERERQRERETLDENDPYN